jgi:hypothetical protein
MEAITLNHTVHAKWITSTQIAYKCPTCRKVHFHSHGKSNTANDVLVKYTHCHKEFGGYTEIVIDNDTVRKKSKKKIQ